MAFSVKTMPAPSSPGTARRFAAWRRPLSVSLAATAGAMLAGALVGWWIAPGPVLAAAVAAGVTCALLVPWALLAGEHLRGRHEQDLSDTHDELTGVPNRRHFMIWAERELSRCRRYQTPGALLLVDADHFKRINDRHGRDCGDALLREITRATQGSLRQPDLLARFGGEELIVFLPHTDPLGALDVADRVRERVSTLAMAWQGLQVRTTVSIGVAALEPGHSSLDALIHDANSALFAAKEAGRNCVRAAPIRPRRSGESPPAITRRH